MAIEVTDEALEISSWRKGPRLDQFAVNLERLVVTEAAMDRHVAAIAKVEASDVITKWFAVVL